MEIFWSIYSAIRRYGFELPEKEAKNVVLTCRSNMSKKDTTCRILIFIIFVFKSGRRILVAQERMASLGYTSLRLYRSADIFGFWFCLAKLKVTNNIIVNFLQGQHQRLEGKWRPSTITVRGVKIVVVKDYWRMQTHILETVIVSLCSIILTKALLNLLPGLLHKLQPTVWTSVEPVLAEEPLQQSWTCQMLI